MKKILLGFVLSLFVFTPALAQKAQVLEFFHGRDCPHCHKEQAWFPTLKEAYPGLDIKMYEVWYNEENQALMQKRLQEIGEQSDAVPTNIIEGEMVVGFDPGKIVDLLEKNYGAPATDRDALLEAGANAKPKADPTPSIDPETGEPEAGGFDRDKILALLAVILGGGGLFYLLTGSEKK